MQEAITHPTIPSEGTDGLEAAALRAEAWAGEPFLRPDENAAEALAPGRARRTALDDALAELEAGRRSPSAEWKVRYALVLGLERVITDHPPRLKSGTELRRHQIDALAGLLTELIAKLESADEEENGNGEALAAEGELTNGDEEPEARSSTRSSSRKAEDPGAVRRFRFRHPTASGKTIAAGGFVEAARTMGVLILTHRRLLVKQFERDLTTEGYGDRLPPGDRGRPRAAHGNPITIQTYAWFARHVGSLSRSAYQLVICDEAHTALGEKTSAAIRSFTEPIYVGMTATEQLIAKQVSDVFPASVDDLPLGDAARRGLIAPLRCLRVPPAAAISSVPIVGGDYEQDALAKVLDHELINQAAASLYRDRFDNTPGIVYAAGVDHAYNLAREFRAAGLKAEAVSGRTPPLRLAETLAAYERGEINVLINAQLLAEGWNSPRATVCMHLAPTASRRVYQQRIGRVMRMHPRKEAGVVVDFVDAAATHNERTITLHSLLDSDFYRPGARVTPAPRRRIQRRAVASFAGALARPGDAEPAPAHGRDHAGVGARRPRQARRRRAAPLGAHRRPPGPLRRAAAVRGEARQGLRECRETFLMSCAAENPNRRLRLAALGDRVAISVDRASFDDLVSMVTSAPTWEKDRVQGVRVLLRALGENKVEAPEDIVVRWTWRLARATRKLQDRRASADLPDAKRLLGALTNSRGHRHEENAARLVNVALEQPIHVAVALLASAEAYTPTAQQLVDKARERHRLAGRDRQRARRQPARAEAAQRTLRRRTPEAQVEVAGSAAGVGARAETRTGRGRRRGGRARRPTAS